MSTHDSSDGSLMAFDQYMRQVKRSAPLTDEEEAWLVECVERGRAEGTKACPDRRVLEQAREARDRLVEQFQRLVVHIACQYARFCRGMDMSDLVQEGNIGLFQAVERYESRQGHALTAFVSRSVRGAVLKALCRRDGMVRVDDAVLQALRQVRLAQERFMAVVGREPSVEELAAEMGVGVSKVVELLEVQSRRCVASLQGMLAEDRDEDGYHFVSAFVGGAVADVTCQQQLEDLVQGALETALTPRQREIVQLRYGLGADDQRGQSQQEVASRLGVSCTCIRNAESGARWRLARLLRPGMQDGQVCYAVRSTRHDDHYTAKEASQRLGLTTKAFYHQVYRGAIPGVRGQGRKDVWLFSKDVIDRMAEDCQLESVS